MRTDMHIWRYHSCFLFPSGLFHPHTPGVPMSTTRTQRAVAPSASPTHDGRHNPQPILQQRGQEIQSYGQLTRMPLALDEKVCGASVAALNQILVDTMTLCDLYK